ncbi:hypothetical protein A8A54_21190 [Brucella pseudogrignonensis]|nr:hypothetical protein A8A54_21190 [Brucella pseudogrignonensis]
MVVTEAERCRVHIATMVTINALDVGERVASRILSTIARLGAQRVWAKAGSAASLVIIVFKCDAAAVVDMANTSATRVVLLAL